MPVEDSERSLAIETQHEVMIPNELAERIALDDPLRTRLKEDVEFARLFTAEELGYIPTKESESR